MSTAPKPRLAVVGVGSYFSKIEAGIQEFFELVCKLDAGDYDPSPGGLKERVAREGIDAVMLLTPHGLHADHIVELAELRKPVMVEKPLVTNKQDLERVRSSSAVNPNLYCSDFYVDVRGIPLFSWLGRPFTSGAETWLESAEVPDRARFGAIKKVKATLLEGVGWAASFDGRPWLWDKVHGGVLWDMGYHHLVVWAAAIGEELSVGHRELGYHREHPAETSAEIFADVRFRSPGGIEFQLLVGKYQERDDRRFMIEFENGEAEMRFEIPDAVILRHEGAESKLVLSGDLYSRTAQAFRLYVDRSPGTPSGLKEARFAVEKILEARS